MKVLIIPSWFPNKESKVSGIFFLKQAELLAATNDVRILIGKENLQGYRKASANVVPIFKNKYRQSDHFINSIPCVKLHQFEFTNYAFLSEEKKLKRLADIYQAYFSRQILPKWQPEIIHAHDVFMAGLVARRLKQEMKIPYVITSHSPISYDSWSPRYIQKFKEVLQHADRVLTVSDYDKRIILNSVNHTVNPVTIGNYVDERIFSFFPKQKSSKFVFLYIASSSRRKDFPTLLSVIQILKGRSVNPFIFKLVIADVKDGISLDDIKKGIKEKDINNFVEIVENIALNQLLALYRETDLYVSSSYLETFGVAVAEAMSCGVPVVAADNGGVRDIIESGVNGIIVPIQDPEALAGKILDFMKGDLQFDRTSISKSICQKFGTAAYSNNLQTIYSQVVP